APNGSTNVDSNVFFATGITTGAVGGASSLPSTSNNAGNVSISAGSIQGTSNANFDLSAGGHNGGNLYVNSVGPSATFTMNNVTTEANSVGTGG
ncbi:hypothetical protein ABTD43_18255, partial [Acinetobacter baumannii]